MPARVTLPLYMRLGARGKEQLVGYTSWDLDTGEPTTDLSRMEAAFPQMMDDSPELQAFGIERERGET
ncbi:hypothetical protein [Streptomyces sp. WAC 01529]|uniref:hypothetical protein n=1 Tax=Streptomyces sp. WAC 01529 TaxID=2203205 RepID=UPI000F73FC12|nr:hypothetical protein [Streptomyces sp. WAC 01529]